MSNLALKLVEGTKADRDKHIDKVDVLDKVKGLIMLPDDKYTTIKDTAEYFGVPRITIEKAISRNRSELDSDGIETLKGQELKEYRRDILYIHNVSLSARAHLTLIPRRGILRLAMLLTDSDVAKEIRDYLLNVEESSTQEQKQNALKYEGEWTPELDNYIVQNVKQGIEKGDSVYRSLNIVAGKLGVKRSTIQGRWYVGNKALKNRLINIEKSIEQVVQLETNTKNSVDTDVLVNIQNTLHDVLSQLQSVNESNDKLHKGMGVIWRSQKEMMENIEEIHNDVMKISNIVETDKNEELTSLQNKVKVLNGKMKTQQKENDELLKFIGKSNFMAGKFLEDESEKNEHLKFKMDRNGNLSKM